MTNFIGLINVVDRKFMRDLVAFMLMLVWMLTTALPFYFMMDAMFKVHGEDGFWIVVCTLAANMISIFWVTLLLRGKNGKSIRYS